MDGMIILLDKDYQEKLLKRGLSTEEKEAFEILFSNCRYGKLFLKADLVFYETMLSVHRGCFSLASKTFLKFATEKFTTIMGDVREVEPLIVLSEKGHSCLSSNSPAVCTIKDLPDNLSPYIYCENLDDASFFMKIYRLFGKSPSNLFIREDAYHGGNTSNIEHKLKQNDIFFCVCDCDKKYEGCDLGGTAESVKNCYLNEEHRFSYYYVLSVREIENLVPCSLYKKAITEPDALTLLGILEKAQEYSLDFFDIKSGYSKECRKKYSHNSEWLLVNGPIIKAAKRKRIYHSKKDSKRLILGVGEKAMNSINKCAFTLDLFSKMTKRQKEDIDYIVQQICRYGYAYPCGSV